MTERPGQVANIQLQGEPYQRTITDGGGITEMIDCNVSLDVLAHNANYALNLPEKIDAAEPHLSRLKDGGGYYGIDALLKHGKELEFGDAFSLATFVASSLNRPLGEELALRVPTAGDADTHMLQAVALFAAMSAKEGYANLTSNEIAGLAAATVDLDTVVRTPHDQSTIAFGGMGGDKGYPIEGGNSKLFSLSTLSAIALATTGSVHKHHSYPNTSKVAGQSAIEAYGARSDFHSPEAFEMVLKESDLLMSSCHNTRALHTLSHRLRGETINHIIGPLAFTMDAKTPLHGFIGVNEKVHPSTIIGALQKLNDTGYQRYASSAVYCGTDLKHAMPEMLDEKAYYNSREAKEHVRLDEIAPPPFATLASFLVNGENAGTYVLNPEDFYSQRELDRISLSELVIPNTTEAILHFNTEALKGSDPAKARYLAMTIGLGLFLRKYAERPDALDADGHRVNRTYLREATAEGLDVLTSGAANDKLNQYVETTQRYAGQKGIL
jgi:anthranilate phosphoribosyltransferase